MPILRFATNVAEAASMMTSRYRCQASEGMGRGTVLDIPPSTLRTWRRAAREDAEIQVQNAAAPPRKTPVLGAPSML